MEKKKTTNEYALIGLILSITLSSLIGLILSIIGLKKAKEYENYDQGRTMAIVGIVISIFRLVVSTIAIIGVIFSTIIWPQVRSDIKKSAYCAMAYDCSTPINGVSTCKYCQSDDLPDCSKEVKIECSTNK